MRNFPEKGNIAMPVATNRMAFDLEPIPQVLRDGVSNPRANKANKTLLLCAFWFFFFFSVPFIALCCAFHHCKFTLQALLFTCKSASEFKVGFFRLITLVFHSWCEPLAAYRSCV